MKTTAVAAIAVITIIAALGVASALIYNSLVMQEQGVKAQWAQVETQYQRRVDLIPNLVSTVQGYMQFEQQLLQNITALRTQWQAASTLEGRINASTQLDSALTTVIAVYENYPELQSIGAVRDLMFELAGTENRIAVERMKYNEAVQSYNTAIKTIPNVIFANAFGFREMPYFQSSMNATLPA